MERKTVKLLGFNIDTFDFESAVKYAMDLINLRNIDRRGGQIVTINPEMIEYALKNIDFAEIIKNAELVIPDGVGVEMGLKIKDHKVKRIAGIEFSYRLLEECSKDKVTVALIGARPHILNKTAENLKSQIKDLNIIYQQDGYFHDRAKVIADLKTKKPQFILVALGSPRQEEFIKEAKKVLPYAVLIGVGGSFDVWSGEVKRAPVIYQKLGIEWVYRTMKEPWRLKRIFPTLPKFLLRVLFSK